MPSVGLCFAIPSVAGFLMQSLTSSSWVNNNNKNDDDDGKDQDDDQFFKTRNNRSIFDVPEGTIDWYLDEPPEYKYPLPPRRSSTSSVSDSQSGCKNIPTSSKHIINPGHFKL